MSDYDQHNYDGGRREGYTSSNGGRNENRTPRPRFTREGNNAERQTYGGQSSYNSNSGNRGYHRGGNNYNDRQGGYGDRQGSGYNRGNGGYNRSGSYGGGNRYQGGYNAQGGGYQRSEGGYNRGGSYGNRQQGGYQRQSNGYGTQSGEYGRPSYGSSAGGYGNRGGSYGGGNRQQGGYNRGGQGGFNRGGGYNKFSNPGKRRIDYKEEAYDPTKPIRLNKFLANAGVCSRRDADKYIEAGVVKVNGEVITELGHKVLRTDTILFHDQQVKAEKKIYVLLNKPKGYVTTSEDPQNRKTVMDLVRNACMERIYPVGRLDRNTTGVLLLTNDGEMASKLTHPKFLKKKIYHVYLDRNVTAADLRQIAEGITLEDGDIRADAVDYASETDKKQVGIEIHSGKNRIVRRIFASLGYNVVKLDRVYFAGLTKKNVKRGDWRFLTEEEVRMLRMGSFE
jgi:pseudouridylate synthase